MRDVSKRIRNLPSEKHDLLSALLKRERSESESRHIPPRPQHAESPPLSYAQQRMWFLSRLAPNDPYYNLPYALRMIGALNVAALERAFNDMIRRHEVLRTTFETVHGQPLQVVRPSLSWQLPLVDVMHGIPRDQQETRVQQLAIEESRRPFDLAQGPLLRASLLKLDHEEHVLLYTMHHIIADGWSMGVFHRELSILYNALCRDQPSPLPDMPIQYADFAVWQRAWLQGNVLDEQLAYWRQQLRDAPVFELPTDRPRPAVQTFRGRTQLVDLPLELSEQLRGLSRGAGVTLFQTLLAAFQSLLCRYTGQEDVLVGSPIANRNRGEIEGLIGFFANTVVLRTDMMGDPTFREVLARVRAVTLDAYAHQDIPFEMLVERLKIERDSSRNPLFQIVFVLQNAPVEPLRLPHLTLSPLALESGNTRFDLECHLWEHPDGIRGQLNANIDLFDDATIAQLFQQFQTLLEGVVANPDQRLSQLPVDISTSLAVSDARGAMAWPSPSDVEAVLLSSPLVDASVVLERQLPNASAVRVAYVVPSALLRQSRDMRALPAQLTSHLATCLPAASLPRAYVPVAHLPLTPTGEVDTAALYRLPVIEAALVQEVEETLQAMPEIEQVAVVAREPIVQRQPLHLSDLLPDWERSNHRYAAQADAPEVDRPGPVAHGDRDVSVVAHRPSLSEGAALPAAEDGPETLAACLQRAAHLSPDKGVVYIRPDDTDVFQSYPALLNAATRLLAGLRQTGMQPGDKVIFQLEDNRDFVSAFWGCVLGGLIPVPMSVPLAYEFSNSAVNKLRSAWQMLDRPMILASAGLVSDIASLSGAFRVESVDSLSGHEPDANWHDSAPDDVALMLLTSGSTGLPKAVMQSHRSLLGRCAATAQMNAFSHRDISLNWMPLDHVGGVVMFHLRDVFTAGTQVHAPTHVVLG